MALLEGRVDPASLYKGGDVYSGTLKTINKGSAVQWGKSLCATCNGVKSQPFDLAYEVLSEYLWQHQDYLWDRSAVSIPKIFGPSWVEPATHAARYLGKQLACALVDQRMPLPSGLVNFLDGAPSCVDVSFELFKDRARRDLHRLGGRLGEDFRGYWLGGLEVLMAADLSRLTGATYVYYIGFVGLRASWREDVRAQSFFEKRRVRLETEGEPLPPDAFGSVSRQV